MDLKGGKDGKGSGDEEEEVEREEVVKEKIIPTTVPP
jgi:hypothetical protein